MTFDEWWAALMARYAHTFAFPDTGGVQENLAREAWDAATLAARQAADTPAGAKVDARRLCVQCRARWQTSGVEGDCNERR